ncbi:MAG: threonine synthase [Alphaproteobacteria bacterium]|nr:threonine synthase [Alphaproteobacteria bacterium]
MHYEGSRGGCVCSFEEALFSGLAPDGGLYVPVVWPSLTPSAISGYAGSPYAFVAHDVIFPFLGSCISKNEFRVMVEKAYSGFTHPAVVPLVQTGANDFILELFHGPTMAFKDIAMQLISGLMDHMPCDSGRHKTLLCATSGDTGAAAVEAFRDCQNMDLFILHPKGRVSEIQRRQMTTVKEGHIHNIALEGSFDDCQRIVKTLFSDCVMRERFCFSGINSINWARIVAQVVYYISAAASLGAPHRKIAFSVPTGNFGDIYAGYVAHCMGLNIERLIIGTNVNDLLTRVLRTGVYEVQDVIATQSPSMDIQLSSNFERLLFDLTGRDSSCIAVMMESLKLYGRFVLDEALCASLHHLFCSYSCNEEETVWTMKDVFRRTGLVIDPHTAVGVKAARSARSEGAVDVDTVLVTLATAHPSKFPKSVRAATGIFPDLPERVSDLYAEEERYEVLPNDVRTVSCFIETQSRRIRY